jgi:membrane protease YdiL (CAAX protease family)
MIMRRYNKVSEHTKIGWYLGIIAIIVELSLGFTYAFSVKESDKIFGITTLIEGSMALIGLFLIDIVYGNSFDIKPDRFKKVDNYKTFKATIYTFGVLFLVQLLLQFPLTVRTWQRVFAIWFAGPSEELFFRGLLLAPFLREADQNKQSKDIFYKRYSVRLSEKITLISISLIEFTGITISAIVFALLHYNYYDSRILIMMVLLSGIVLGIAYQRHRNLLANILAHMLLNVLVTFQTFGILIF